MESVLTLSLGGFPPLSARGCEQILRPIQLGKMQRTVNGELVHLGIQELKYQSVVKAKDRTVLACNGLYPGVLVEVGCLQPIWEKINNPKKKHFLMREPIEGSLCILDDDQDPVAFTYQNGYVVISDSIKNHDIFVCYRPKLTMRVTDFIIKTNEWSFESSWELFLEEI